MHKQTLIASFVSIALLAGVGMTLAQTITPTPSVTMTPMPISEDARSVGSTIETHISDNGKVLVRGAKITGISGSVINVSVTKGSYVMNWVVTTDSSTELIRRWGGNTSLSEMQVGDYISFLGMLDQTQTVATIKASIVKDWSIQRAHASFAGVISNIYSSNQKFTLDATGRGSITVVVLAATKITKGGTTIAFADLKVGDRITSTSGLFDNLQKTLAADDVRVYVNRALMEKRVFEGTVKSIAGTIAPTTFVLTVNGIDYTVNVLANISIIGKTWLSVSLANFKAGDKVRVYGAVEANSTTTIDASIVRDVNL